MATEDPERFARWSHRVGRQRGEQVALARIVEHGVVTMPGQPGHGQAWFEQRRLPPRIDDVRWLARIAGMKP